MDRDVFEHIQRNRNQHITRICMVKGNPSPTAPVKELEGGGITGKSIQEFRVRCFSVFKIVMPHLHLLQMLIKLFLLKYTIVQ